MPKFSIILPIYNGELYLKNCIKSVLNQTFQDFELIIIDDGSTDSTLETCKLYAKKDNRIKLIHQENAGLSGARNTGLDVAIGDYIIFIDCDDSIKHNLLEDLVKVVSADTLTHYGFSLITNNEVTSSHTDGGIIDILSGKGGEVWRCCFPSCIRGKIRFSLELNGAEDYIFSSEAYCLLKKIKVVSNSYYFYTTDNPTSIMHTNVLLNLDKQIKATIYVEKLLKKHNLLSKENRKALAERKSWCKEQLFKYGSKTLPAKKTLLSRITHKALFVVLKRLYRWDY